MKPIGYGWYKTDDGTIVQIGDDRKTTDTKEIGRKERRKKKRPQYPYPKTPALVAKLKPYWERMEALRGKFYEQVTRLEIEMSKATGIGNMIFFMSDGEHAGIGNLNRSLELIPAEELEK